jgi:hypothetical protein
MIYSGVKRQDHFPERSLQADRVAGYLVGDIGYWSPGHDIAIYYRKDGEKIPSPGIIKVGHFDSGVAAFNVPGSVEVSIERVQ